MTDKVSETMSTAPLKTKLSYVQPGKLVKALTQDAARSIVEMIMEENYEAAEKQLQAVGSYATPVIAQAAIMMDRKRPSEISELLRFVFFMSMWRQEPNATACFYALVALAGDTENARLARS